MFHPGNSGHGGPNAFDNDGDEPRAPGGLPPALMMAMMQARQGGQPQGRPIPPPMPAHDQPGAPPMAKHVHQGGRCPHCGLRKV